MLEAFEVTAAQANAVRKALKLLSLRYWRYTIDNHPLKKPMMRIVFRTIGRPDPEDLGREWNKINAVLGANNNDER